MSFGAGKSQLYACACCAGFVKAAPSCIFTEYSQLRSMPKEITYSSARASLGKLCDEVVKDRRVVIIRRRSKASVALISAGELSSLMEMLHLIKSPKNAERLLRAIRRAKSQR
jgi:antitoxin YefM